MDQSLIFLLLIAFMVGMLFLSSRQRKKQQAQQETLQNSLNVGDVVVMTSGISGTIVDVDDERTIDLEIAPDVVTTWLRAAVREKLSPEADPTLHPEVDAVDATEVVDRDVPTPSTGSAPGSAAGDGAAGSGVTASETRRS